MRGDGGETAITGSKAEAKEMRRFGGESKSGGKGAQIKEDTHLVASERRSIETGGLEARMAT